MILKEIEQYVDLMKKGDTYAFEFLFRMYYPRLCSFSKKFLFDESLADDIVQNIFIKLWENRTSFECNSFESYIFKAVRNSCLNHLKHQKIVSNYKVVVQKETRGEDLYYLDFMEGRSILHIREELYNEITHIIEKLPPQCKNVFKLSRLSGMKNREIAEELNISIKVVEKHISKALKRLREHFSDRVPYLVILAIISECL